MNGRPWIRWQDWTNLVAAVYLLLVPSMFSTTSSGVASWDTWIVGIVVGLVALWALGVPRSRSAEWTQVVAGAWLFVAPWALGFTGIAAAAWNSWIVGVVVVVLAGWALGQLSAGQRTTIEAGERHLPHAA